MSPRYARSFGTFDHAFPLVGVKGFMPPQGILVVAWLPPDWQVRVIDENVRPVSEDDLRWAEVVFLSGMHVQRDRIDVLTRRAHQHGRLVVLGGPSVSAPSGTQRPTSSTSENSATVARLNQDVGRPAGQELYRATEKLPVATSTAFRD